jgi:hypothetical protein
LSATPAGDTISQFLVVTARINQNIKGCGGIHESLERMSDSSCSSLDIYFHVHATHKYLFEYNIRAFFITKIKKKISCFVDDSLVSDYTHGTTNVPYA